MDEFLQHWVNREHVSPFLDQVMASITNFSAWLPLLVGASIVVFIFGNFRMRAMLVCLLVALALTDGVIVNGIKHAVGRLRPFQAEEGVRQVHLVKKNPQMLAMALPPKVEFSKAPVEGAIMVGRSFPSSHSSNIMVSATVIFLFYRRFGWGAFFIAALVFYSRLYTGAHWPSDILAGAILGFCIACGVVSLLNWAWKKWGRCIAPRLAESHPTLR